MKRQRLTSRIAASTEAADKRKKKKQDENENGRNLDGFEYDTAKANVLKKALHNINVSLGTLLAAMKDLALLRGSDVTPDGKLGGRGFIMNFREMKSSINQAISDLSDITDTLADELTNPKWGLTATEKKKVKREKKEIEEKVEEIEEEVPEGGKGAPGEGAPGEEAPEEEAPKEEASKEEEIEPGDVKDSSEIESIKRYQNLIDGNTNDKVASLLGKNIMANLLKGE